MTKYFLKTGFLLALTALSHTSFAQYTKQDTLRGSNTAERSWWDVKQYALDIQVHITDKEITGTNRITFEVTQPGKNKVMQIDLQPPMEIERIEDGGNRLSFTREGNVYRIDFGDKWSGLPEDKALRQSISIYFKGKPREAVNPPWDGGWIWSHDARGRSWITVACQELGASAWYPCKDYQGDEPEEGSILSVEVPDTLTVVSNGVQADAGPVHKKGTAVYTWTVKSPINNYNIVPYIGKYVSWSETYAGEKGPLTCEYWVLDYNLEKAKKHFSENVKPMLKCFEGWFGPYPFYTDHYKLVDAPHLGMEHQSAVAYGNQYKNGYLGTDLSASGWGKEWDYIIVHESGHEWFGNNITTEDIADMWVHEGFTTYSEELFVECQYGKKAASEYLRGLRNNIRNDKPVIGPYGINKSGSDDMYFKGANLIHTIRQVIDNDNTFKEILRGLNKDFYQQVVTSAQIEKYISDKSKQDLSKIFDQYLRTTAIPRLEWKQKDKKISYRWTNCVAGFNMPVKLETGTWLKPVTTWQTIDTSSTGGAIRVVPDFYIETKKS